MTQNKETEEVTKLRSLEGLIHVTSPLPDNLKMIFAVVPRYEGLDRDGIHNSTLHVESFIRTSALPEDLLSQVRERLGFL